MGGARRKDTGPSVMPVTFRHGQPRRGNDTILAAQPAEPPTIGSAAITLVCLPTEPEGPAAFTNGMTERR